MITGLLAGLLWGLDTVILGVVMTSTQLVSTTQALLLAPFISTFLHDSFSTIWMFIYMLIKKQVPQVFKELKTKGGKIIALAALLGGPIGMTGYVVAIKYIGPTYTAIISAFFPALGALLSYIFLKEKMKKSKIIALIIAIIGVIGLGYTPGNSEVDNIFIGFVAAIICVIGWASEAVLCSYALKYGGVNDDVALQIRQFVSALFYGVIIMNLISGWNIATDVIASPVIWFILIAALFGTASYLCYYKAIGKLGATRAMSLNITYSAWALIFSIFILGVYPDLKSILFGVLIVVSSLYAASR